MAVITLPGTEASLAAFTAPVPLSGSLAYHVNATASLGSTSNLRPALGLPTLAEIEADPRMAPHYSPPVGKPSAADVSEAVRKLPEAEHLCRPADPRLIAAWCGRMRTLPWAPTDARASQEAIAAICMACGDLPVAVWTAETAAIALRTWTRWPAPALVYGLLSDLAKPFERMRDGLRKVVRDGRPEPPRKVDAPTQAARDAVSDMVRGLVQEQAVAARNRAPEPVHRPGSSTALAPAALLAIWEKAAANKVPGAQQRVDTLRKQILGLSP